MNEVPAQTGARTGSHAEPTWPRDLEAWRSLLADCAGKPSKKHVHALRVSTLRLQAQFMHWLDRNDAAHPATGAIERWNKQAKCLRRGLGAVRDCDIYVAKLGQLRATLTTPDGYQPRTSRAALQRIQDLERRFERDRRAASEQLGGIIEKRAEKIEASIAQIESELSTLLPLVPLVDRNKLAQMADDVISQFPSLCAEDLHDLRKQIKSVRYLSELMSASDPDVAQLAADLKTMQGAIGEWHDWDELGRRTAEALRHEAKRGGLVELIETVTEEALDKALHICENFRSRFASEDRAPAQKKPVQRATASTDAGALCA